MLKLWVAAFGTYLLGRSLGMRFGGALLAGIVFALNLKMVTWLLYPAHERVDAASRGCCSRPIGWSGGPTCSAGAGLAAVVGAPVPVRPPGVELPRAAGGRGLPRAAAVAGPPQAGRRAVQLRAAARVRRRAWRAARRWPPSSSSPSPSCSGSRPTCATGRRRRSTCTSPSSDALGLFLPDYWGRPTQTPLRPFLLERALYVGALPLMLAAAALVLRPTVERVAVALFGALWLGGGARRAAVPADRHPAAGLQLGPQHAPDRVHVLARGAAGRLGPGRAELRSRRLGRARRASCWGSRRRCCCVPPAVAIAASRLRRRRDGRAGSEVAWLFADPPGAHRRARAMRR